MELSRSTPETSLQNGRAERKNRTLIEAAKMLWAELFTTTAYVIRQKLLRESPHLNYGLANKEFKGGRNDLLCSHY